VLLVRWMSIEWRQGRARAPVPWPPAEPGRLLPRRARILVLVLACLVAYGLFATVLVGNIYLEGMPWPQGEKRYLALSVLTLPRDWHFSWLNSVTSSLSGAIVDAAFGGLGLVVLATRGRERLAPAVAAICAIWSAMMVIGCAAAVERAPRPGEWPHPYGALELWLGIFLPAFAYALLLVALLIPPPLLSLVTWSRARFGSRSSTTSP
jgi:hypothetical protein